MTKDEALRMVLRWFTDVSTNNEDEVIQACKEALAETQEPVAWMHYKDFTLILHDVWEELIEGKDEWYPMYQYKGENMSTHKQQVVTLILTNPENGEEMFFASLITNNNDGSYSFEVANKDNSTRYKHTIKTEEIL
jgi:hypothetical protein